MEDYKETVERTLNELRRAEKYCLNDYSRMAGNAANIIENLQTENAALRRHIDNLTDAQAVMVKEFTEKLEELAQAEQDGRLVVLPSKTVWELTMDAGPDCDLKCPVDAYDEALGCDLCSKAKPFAYERPCTQERLKGLGKTVFLTREEAEAALAGKGVAHEADSV